MKLKTETLGHGGMARIALAALAFSALSALCGCTVQGGADSQREAPGSVVAAVDNAPAWPEFATLPREVHAAVELSGGRVLVCGGRDTSVFPTAYPTVCEDIGVDSLGRSAQVKQYPLPEKRVYPTLTVFPDSGDSQQGGYNVLLAGGQFTEDASHVVFRGARVWPNFPDWSTSNAGADIWSTETAINPHAAHTASLLNDQVVLVGGNPASAGIDVLSLATKSWTNYPLSRQLTGHSATVLQSAAGVETGLLVLGGSSLATGFIFAVSDQVASSEDIPMEEPRAWHTATLLDDRSILVVGGESYPLGNGPQVAYSQQAKRYLPETKTWQKAGETEPRKYHGAAKLGRYVIVVGGEGPDSAGTAEALYSVQSFDTQSGLWSKLLDMKRARRFLQISKLDDSHLLASGGNDGRGSVASSEVVTALALGQPPSDGDPRSCASGHAADGVCCESDCAASCQVCGSDGLCVGVSGTPRNGRAGCPDALLCFAGTCPTQCDDAGRDCAADHFCQSGVCRPKKATGVQCGASLECANGKPCQDGFCCEAACEGPCESCNQKQHPGICLALEADALPLATHPQCPTATDSSCAQRCDGQRGDSCVFPARGSSCAEASCTAAGFQPERTCNGRGTCQSSAIKDCGAFRCETSGCLKTCDDDLGCSDGAHCAAGRCVNCSEDQCLGYTCDAVIDACRSTCQQSETDCLGGYFCHPLKHRCVPVPVPYVGQLPSCSVRAAGRRGALTGPAVAMILGVALLGKRSRRRTRGGVSVKRHCRTRYSVSRVEQGHGGTA